MTIDELLAIIGLTASDEIPIWDAEATGEPTKKITAQDFATAMFALAGGLHSYSGTTSSQWPIAVENEQEILLMTRIGANGSSNVYLSLTIPTELMDATERQFATQGMFGTDVCSLLVKVTSTTITLDARVNGSSSAIFQTLIYGVR